MTVIAKEIRAEIVRQMQSVYNNTLYQLQLELKIQSQLSLILKRDTAEAEKQIMDRMRDCQLALELLVKELESED
jgi:hypothetical protein